MTKYTYAQEMRSADAAYRAAILAAAKAAKPRQTAA